MKESFKVFLVCFCGAVIGGLFSYTALPTWWSLALGCAVGFVAGYIGYDLRGAVSGVKETYRKTVVWRPSMKTKATWLFLLSILSSGAVCGLPLFVGVDRIALDAPLAAVRAISFYGMILWWFSCTVYLSNRVKSELPHEQRLRALAKTFHVFMIFGVMPVVGMMFVLKWIPAGIPKVLHTIKNFALAFIRIVHSSERVICGVDTMVGVMIAFMLRNTVLPDSTFSLLLGGAVGGLFGVAHSAMARSISKAFERGWNAGKSR